MRYFFAAIVCLALICSCAPKPEKHIVGNDKDIHGCIASAGYTWCAKKGKCIRPWEETCE